MRYRGIFAIATVLAVCAGAGCKRRIGNTEVTEYGIYAVSGGQTYEDSSSPTGRSSTWSNVRFAKQTKIIPRKLGTHFGVSFIIHGTPKGAPLDITKKVILPDLGITDPRTGKRTKEWVTKSTIHFEEEFSFGYCFDHSWEMVPGNWIYRIYFRDNLLKEFRFTVKE